MVIYRQALGGRGAPRAVAGQPRRRNRRAGGQARRARRACSGAGGLLCRDGLTGALPRRYEDPRSRARLPVPPVLPVSRFTAAPVRCLDARLGRACGSDVTFAYPRERFVGERGASVGSGNAQPIHLQAQEDGAKVLPSGARNSRPMAEPFHLDVARLNGLPGSGAPQPRHTVAAADPAGGVQRVRRCRCVEALRPADHADGADPRG